MNKLNIKKERHTSLSYELRSLLYKRDNDDSRQDFPEGTKLLLGYALPSFQREAVWTEYQKVKFIESAFYGYDLGFFMVSSWEMKMGAKILEPYSDCLIDGYQRFTALDDYWNNKFKVFGYFWSELSRADHSIMLSSTIGHKIIDTIDPEKLKEAYNRLNFSGTNHKESERA